MQLEQAQQLAKAQPPRDDLNIVPTDLAPQDRGSGPVIAISPQPIMSRCIWNSMTADYQSFRAELMTQTDDRKLWQSGKLKPRTKGQSKIVDVNLRASLLTLRGYTIVLKGISANGQEETVRDYSFRVVQQ